MNTTVKVLMIISLTLMAILARAADAPQTIEVISSAFAH